MKKNKRKLILLLAIIMLILGGSKLLDSAKNILSTAEKDIEQIKELETGHEGTVIYHKKEEGLLQYRGGSLLFYDIAGTQKWHAHLGVPNPKITANSNSVYIIEDRGNQLLRVGKNGEVVYRYTSEEAIINLETCEKNYVILQHPVENNITKLTILNEEGREQGNILLTEGEVVNLSISKKHDFVAVNTLKTDNTLESNIITYDINGQLIGSSNLGGQLVLNFSYDAKGNLVVVKEEEVSIVDRTNEILWNAYVDKVNLFKELPTEYMVFYSGNRGKNPLIQTESGEKLKTLEFNGREIGETSLEEGILGLDVSEEGIVAYSLRTIYLLDKKGNVEMEYKYSSDIEKVFVFSKGYLTVVTKERIAFMRIKES